MFQVSAPPGGSGGQPQGGLELYFEGEPDSAYTPATDLNVGQELVNS